MAQDIIIGRSKKETEELGKKGLLHIGKSYVRMENDVSLSNNVYLDVNKSHVILISGKRGSGKCLHGDTLITLSDGSVKAIKDLEKDKGGVLALNNKLKVTKGKKRAFYKREVDRLIKLKLRSGREIKLTPEHPLLTIKGWKPVEELTIGSRIAVPRQLEYFGDNEMPEYELKLLSYLIAEGHTKRATLFTNYDFKIVDEFRECMKRLDGTLELREDKKGHYRISCPTWKTVCLDSSGMILDKLKRFSKGSRIVLKKGSIREFTERVGLYGKSALEKNIPEDVFRLNKKLLSLFLNRLFSCDGSIYKDKKGNSYLWEISYSSSSKKLIHQVQHLILRFGILSKLRKKKIKNGEKKFISYELVINEVVVPKFIKEIGFFGEKEIKQERALKEILISKKVRNPNVDTIPKEIWELYKPENWAKIGRFAGYKHPKAMRERIRYSPSRQTLQMISEAEQNNSLKLLAESDIFWDEINSMEIMDGKFKVYDITVPELHNFVANDIIVHNSYNLGVIAEEMSSLDEETRKRIAVVMIDTMGIFWSMKYPNTKQRDDLRKWGMEEKGFDVKVFVPKGKFEEYQEKGIPADYLFSFRPKDLRAEDWCKVFNVDLTSLMGVLIERVLGELEDDYNIDDILEKIEKDTKSEEHTRYALINRFEAAKNLGIFDEEGTSLKEFIISGKTSILDVSCYEDWNVKNLVVGLLGKKLLSERVDERKKEEIKSIRESGSLYSEKGKQSPLIWLVIDEAQEFIPRTEKTAASDALTRLLREGRQPGISMILATQQPGEIHKDVMTQSDIVISHRITAQFDIEALNSIMQTYLTNDLLTYINNLPSAKGSAIILDDNNERIFSFKVRPKMSWHGGDAPSAVKIEKKLFEE